MQRFTCNLQTEGVYTYILDCAGGSQIIHRNVKVVLQSAAAVISAVAERARIVQNSLCNAY